MRLSKNDLLIIFCDYLECDVESMEAKKVEIYLENKLIRIEGEEMKSKNWKQPYFDEDGYAYGDTYMKKSYGWRCNHPGNLLIGDDVDIGCFTYLNAKHGIVIGKNTQIGSHCSIYSDNTENSTYGKVVIGDNVRIGSYCLILPNIYIADNTKIRARSNIISNLDLCVHVLNNETTMEWVDADSCDELRCRICGHVDKRVMKTIEV